MLSLRHRRTKFNKTGLGLNQCAKSTNQNILEIIFA